MISTWWSRPLYRHFGGHSRSVRGLLILLWVSWLLPMPAWACTFFVSADGGTDSNPGSESRPFKTIQAAANAALSPGDAVCVMPGHYFENSQQPPAANIKGVKVRAGGVSGKPIVFQPAPGAAGSVVIDQRHDFSAAPGTARPPTDLVGFYVAGHDYVTIRGFEIKNVSSGVYTRAVNAPKDSYAGVFDPPTGIVIENNHIHAVRADLRNPRLDSNIAPVKINDCYDCLVRGNRLHDVGLINAAGELVYTNQNSAGVHSFGMLRTVIENNEIFDTHSGVFDKSWSKQPLPSDPRYDPARVPPPIDKVADFGVKIRRNLIHDTVLGVRLSASGGNGRVISKSGNAYGNPAHHNHQIYENVFYSTARAGQRLGSQYSRMEWALKTDLRGTVEQSDGLQFYNNTVITHNGIDIDAVTGVKVYNNFFSLSATTPSGLPGPEIALRSRYIVFSAQQAVNSGITMNLGTPENAVPRTTCNDAVDPDLAVAPYISTPPFAASGDVDFYCSDNLQWKADFSLVDFNFYHLANNFQLNRFGRIKPGIGENLERIETFGYWARLSAVETFGLSDDRPDENSYQAPLADPAILEGVIINSNGGVTIKSGTARRFDSDSTAMVGAGRVGGVVSGEVVNIGAFPHGVLQ